MKIYLVYHRCLVTSKGFNISHKHKMKIKAISNKAYMNYEYYIKQPMQMIEQRLNLIFAKNPQLINLLNRGSDHPLIKKYIIYKNT